MKKITTFEEYEQFLLNSLNFAEKKDSDWKELVNDQLALLNYYKNENYIFEQFLKDTIYNYFVYYDLGIKKYFMNKYALTFIKLNIEKTEVSNIVNKNNINGEHDYSMLSALIFYGINKENEEDVKLFKLLIENTNQRVITYDGTYYR